MSKGVLLFAYNNEAVDYRLMAKACARRIERHLKVPVLAVSDSEINGVETIVRADHSKSIRDYGTSHATFKNESRLSAYDISPFDETIVLDVDYVIQTDKLNCLWGSKVEFQIGFHAVDLEGKCLDVLIGLSNLPQVWATVIYFRKSDLANSIFEEVRKVADGWEFYSLLYGIPSSMFRNDYVFAMAINHLSGKQGLPLYLGLPWPILTSDFNTELIEITDRALLEVRGLFCSARADIHVLKKTKALL